MRTIKFRAWDTIKKKMWSAEEMGRDQLTLMPNGEGFINVSSTSTRLSSFLKHLTPLRFVGLKDKNEVEIYEGDIVKIHWAAIELPMWDKKAVKMRHQIDYYLEIKYTNYGFRPYWNNTLWFDWKYLWWNKCEVIGNIYENKNLLK